MFSVVRMEVRAELRELCPERFLGNWAISHPPERIPREDKSERVGVESGVGVCVEPGVYPL